MCSAAPFCPVSSTASKKMSWLLLSIVRCVCVGWYAHCAALNSLPALPRLTFLPRADIGNTQETDRTTVNELVPEKLLMELYGPPFSAAVQNAAAVMCA